MSILGYGKAPYSWEDLESIGDDGTGNRYEILDGGIIVSPPPGSDHDIVAGHLLQVLIRSAPDWADPIPSVGIDLDLGSCLIPDLVVLKRGTPLRRGPVLPEDVLLVVEVESPGSRTADRITKPARYAEVGIPNYWRLMIRDVPPTLLVYELDGDRYVEAGRVEGEQEMTVEWPFPVAVRPAALLR